MILCRATIFSHNNVLLFPAPRKPIIQTRALKKEIKTRKGSKILTEISVELICDLIDGKPIYDFKWSNSRGKTVKCCKFAPCIHKVGDAEDEKIHGRYTCTASNSLGASSRSIFLNTASKYHTILWPVKSVVMPRGGELGGVLSPQFSPRSIL